MTIVKICGITNVDDALAALEFGADSLGFNFYPQSPRYIGPEQVDAIVKKLGRREFVGVFVNSSIPDVVAAIELSGINSVQFHGDESQEYVSRFRSVSRVRVIKALRVSDRFDPAAAAEFEADAILLDGHSASARGGTGAAFDWEIALSAKPVVGQLYLAGGLTPANVAEAIRKVVPYAVDVASGVESRPGKKDLALMEAFITNAKNA
jgi:phosphoribosylanthranilate isomerase